MPQARWQAQCLAQLREIPGVAIVDSGPAEVLLDLGAEHAGVREHLAGERTVTVRFQSVAPDGTTRDLETAALKCVPHSLAATRERIFEVIAAWPARTIRRMLQEKARWPSVQLRVDAGPRQRSALTALQVPLASVRNLVQRQLAAMAEEHWAIGMIGRPVQHVLEGFDASEIRWFEPPAGQVLADPVGLRERDGGIELLAEAYDFRDRQGRIVALQVGADGIPSPPREVLRLPVHASYPHLFEHEGVVYCLPEAHASHRVQLFRADDWRADRVLLDSFAGVDPTVVEHEGRWWLFMGNHADQDETKLYVFHAADPLGPWHAHAANPVKCDIRCSRPAGPFFRRGGELFRPAQDCSRTYGGALAINRIVVLTPEEFREQTVTVLRPDVAGPRPHGLHSLAGIGNFTFVDGKRHTHPLGERFC